MKISEPQVVAEEQRLELCSAEAGLRPEQALHAGDHGGVRGEERGDVGRGVRRPQPRHVQHGERGGVAAQLRLPAGQQLPQLQPAA